MKKSFILVLFFVALIFGCSEEKEKETKFSEFKNYSLFCENKDKWIEPSCYQFSYILSRGDAVVYDPVSIFVSDGKATVDYGGNVYVNKDGNEINIYDDEMFDSISSMYIYFDDLWQSLREDFNKHRFFEVEYTDLSNSEQYPCKFSMYVKNYNSELIGYSGFNLRITDFKIINE